MALLFQLGEEIAVLVPATVHELDKTDAPFQQSPGDQAIVGVAAFFQYIRTIRSFAVGIRDRIRRNAQVIWEARSGLAFMAFSARTRAASVQVMSFRVVKAWRGVEVGPARILQACRGEASNMLTGPTVRRQKV